MNAADQVELKPIGNPEEIRASLKAFCTGAVDHQARVGDLFHRAEYWVYDPDESFRGPSPVNAVPRSGFHRCPRIDDRRSTRGKLARPNVPLF